MGGRQFIVEQLNAQPALALKASVGAVGIVGSRITGTAGAVASSFSKVNGDGQTSTVSTAVAALPSVKVVDSSGLPVSGVSVSFVQLSSLSGVVTGGQQTTNASGIATVGSWSLGTIVGTQRLEVKAGSLSTQTFSATAIAGSAFSVSPSGGTSQTTHVGGVLPSRLTVLVEDSWRNPITGATLDLSSTDGEGVFTVTQITTGAAGTSGFTYGVGPLVASSVASIFATLTSSNTSAVFAATSTASVAAAIAILLGNGQVGLISTALPINPNVQITDAFGNPITSSQVTWVAGAGSLSTDRTPTGSSGTAQTVWTLGNTPGAQQLTARGDFLSGSTVTFDVSASNPQADTIVIVAGNSQSAQVGANLGSRLTVAATGSGQPSQGVLTTWTASDGTLGAATVATGSDGSAGNTYSVGTTARTSRVTVESTGLTGSPLAFTLSVTTAANSSLTMIAQPSSNVNDGVAFAQQPQVQIIDLYGNKCLSNAVTVTAAKASGGASLSGTLTASTDATGLAVFSNLAASGAGQSLTIQFTSSGLTAVTSNAVNVAPPVGSKLAFTVQPTNITAGNIFSPTVVVAVQDSLGNTVPGATDPIQLTISAGGSLTGTTLQNASAGLATFSGLGASGSGTVTITATSGTLTAAVSASFTISASGSNKEPTDVTMTVRVQMDQSALAGQTLDAAFVNNNTYFTMTATTNAQNIKVRDFTNQSWRDAQVGAMPTPTNGSLALVVRVPNGQAQGPKGQLSKTLSGGKTIYIRARTLLSDNFDGHSSNQFKYFFEWPGNASPDYIGSFWGTGTGAIKSRHYFQGSVGGVTLGIQAGVGDTLTRNVWYLNEWILVEESSNGAGDGHVTLYKDGVLTKQVTGISWNASATKTWGLLQWAHYWGGQGDSTIGPFYICSSEFYVSTSVSRTALPT